MRASRIVDVTLVAVGLITAAAGVAIRHVGGAQAVADLVFAAVVVTSLLQVARLVANAFRSALAQRSVARALQRRPTAEAVRQAVADEQARLAADIHTVVGSSVRLMHARAEEALSEDDPIPPLREIQRLGRAATAELRRLLGLLREAEAAPVRPPPVPVTRTGWRLDLGLAAGTTALAVTEHYVENSMSGWLPGTNSVAAVVFTIVAAATLTLRRHAPGAGASMCGLVLLSAAAVGHPVSSGFWMIAGPGVLTYAAMRRMTWLDTCGALTLLGAVAAAFAWRDPVNLSITVQTVAVGGVAGTLVALADRRRTADRAAAARRAAELSGAAAEAVRTERLAAAREVHDVVSHAIGVMVVQAAAAALLLPSDRRRARAAMTVVRSVAQDALRELDTLVGMTSGGALGGPATGTSTLDRPTARQPAPIPTSTGPYDSDVLPALVERMRAAGLTVRLDLSASLDGEPGATAYRIVQEALTNVLRHAPGAAVAVTVRTGSDGMRVEVHDTGAGPAAAIRPGYGLAGITERVQRLGGTLYTGRGRDGTGFRIDARLPAFPPT